MGNYLGLDIGTSGCKAVVFDRRGRILSSAHREYDLITAADGTAELDSEIVIARCFEVITTTARAAGSAHPSASPTPTAPAGTANASPPTAACAPPSAAFMCNPQSDKTRGPAKAPADGRVAPGPFVAQSNGFGVSPATPIRCHT
jgi:hypothetical protein